MGINKGGDLPGVILGERKEGPKSEEPREDFNGHHDCWVT